MTIRMVAKRESIPLKDVKVKISKQRFEESRTDGKGKQEGLNLHRNITLLGNLTDAQTTRLMAVADRCPVHRTLHGLITVSTAQSPV